MPDERIIQGIMDFARKLGGGIDLQAIRDGLELRHFHRRAEQAIENDLGHQGLSARQADILESLYFVPDGVMTPAELAEEVGLTRSAMTSALDSVEQPGYVVRAPHPTDRRMVTVSLTAAGRHFIRELLADRYRKVAKVVSRLSPHERQTMLRAYSLILETLAESAAEGRS